MQPDNQATKDNSPLPESNGSATARINGVPSVGSVYLTVEAIREALKTNAGCMLVIESVRPDIIIENCDENGRSAPPVHTAAENLIKRNPEGVSPAVFRLFMDKVVNGRSETFAGTYARGLAQWSKSADPQMRDDALRTIIAALIASRFTNVDLAIAAEDIDSRAGAKQLEAALADALRPGKLSSAADVSDLRVSGAYSSSFVMYGIKLLCKLDQAAGWSAIRTALRSPDAAVFQAGLSQLALLAREEAHALALAIAESPWFCRQVVSRCVELGCVQPLMTRLSGIITRSDTERRRSVRSLLSSITHRLDGMDPSPRLTAAEKLEVVVHEAAEQVQPLVMLKIGEAFLDSRNSRALRSKLLQVITVFARKDEDGYRILQTLSQKKITPAALQAELGDAERGVRASRSVK